MFIPKCDLLFESVIPILGEENEIFLVISVLINISGEWPNKTATLEDLIYLA